MTQRKLTHNEADVSHDSPDYTIKENPRARHVHLKLSWHGELEIVVPRGFNQRGIPGVIAAKQVWLERARARMRRQTQTLPAEYFEQRPAHVHLQALGETYTVRYQATPDARIGIVESDRLLIVSGPIDDACACVRGLRAWLQAKARLRLAPWLRRTSQTLGLPYTKDIIRIQRSRWGSCSARRVISLNCKLLFLPKGQVHYLFIHELCHTRHLNHSAQYWRFVESKLPDYRRYEAALRDGWRCVPRWAGD